MIYLIQSSAYNKDRTGYIDILKIGYTDNQKNRLGAYINHNPSCFLLLTIDDGTKEDESRLHGYFEKYKIYGNEWYEYKEEIIDFFKDHTTSDSLSVLNKKLSTREKARMLKNPITYIINDYIRDNSEDRINTFLSEFNSITTFIEKMKYLCSNINTYSEKDISRILDLLGDYGLYYNVLGPNRVKALSYQGSKIVEEYNRIIDTQTTINLKNNIYNRFDVCGKYLKSEIKKTLFNLYSDLDFKKTPKANDLEEYFNIRTCKIVNPETGKFEHAFEILSKR